MNILTLPLDAIVAGDRLREVNEDYALLLAASMAEHGQMTPIEVRPLHGQSPIQYALVAGAHRLRALQLAGGGIVVAAVFAGSELEAKLREIDENLIRAELTALDRATFLAERQAVYQALHPETKRGGDRAGSITKFSSFRSFAADAAERLRVSERWVQAAVARYLRLHPDVRRRLTGTWLADHAAQLDQLARLSPSEQLRVVQMLFGDVAEGFERPASVAEASRAIQGVQAPVIDPVAQQFDAFLRLWKRMPASVRRRVRTHINGSQDA